MKTKDCHGFSELLGPFLDGELEPERRRSVEEHLRSCPHCRRELEALQLLHRMVKEKDTGPVLVEEYWDWHRHGVWKGIRAGRRMDSRPAPRPYFFLFRLGTLAAGVAVVFIAVIGGWRLLGTRPGAPESEVVADWLESKAESDLESVSGKASRTAAQKSPASAAGETYALERRAAEVRDEDVEPGLVSGLGAVQEELTRTEAAGAAGTARLGASDRAGSKTAERPMMDEVAAPPPAVTAPSAADRVRSADSWDVVPRLVSISKLPTVSPEDTATVVVRALVELDGTVLQVGLERPSGVQLLDSIAVNNVRRARFAPGVRGGAPARGWVAVPQVFSTGAQGPAENDSKNNPGR